VSITERIYKECVAMIQLGIGRGRVNPMGCRVGYSGVGVRVEVCPPCKDPHPRLGYPGYLGIGWCMQVHGYQISLLYRRQIVCARFRKDRKER